MKRYLIAAVASLAIFALPALADETGCATTHCYVEVNPNISLYPLDCNVDMGTIQTGCFYGYIPWRVDSNTQNVIFWCGASYLYKGDDPTDPIVEPILICEESGVQLHIPDGGPTGAEDECLEYIGPTDIEGFPGLETESVEYESSQPGHMSQDIEMTVCWEQDDPEKPMGEYSGMLRLSAMVVLF